MVSDVTDMMNSMIVQIAKNIINVSNVINITDSDKKCCWVKSLSINKCKSQEIQPYVITVSR